MVDRRGKSAFKSDNTVGYRYLRPRPRHRKADPAQVEAFKQAWPERLDKIAAEHPGKRLRVYFQDESRFGQQGTNTNVWAEKGSRPTAVRQTEYEYLWVIGAVCPECLLELGGARRRAPQPAVEHADRQLILGAVRKTIPEGKHAVMIWDGAGFHTAGALRVPENVTLVKLPPYSPELNPIENLWRYLKSHFSSNRAYADYDALEAAAMAAWRVAVLDQDLVRSVCAAPYLDRATSNRKRTTPGRH
ncbi:hypothetical protein Pla175_26630 [Pirellulimonas nuda]|uniref:Tc1-like transposase DDE domain-containing protein n=1 Tax=Pirellulimonas nuda TaxID=2528009 RepID=A0A518DCR5_9BACT|nr:IS630 family transposase [Pirellulimonas nuda]QDU89275.1 hypothetical protein Pla175_26630 [Pirellulimonas nuda]